MNVLMAGVAVRLPNEAVAVTLFVPDAKAVGIVTE